MTILWPTPLVDAIARRRAVILIGSGVSANSKTDGGIHPLTWGAFLDAAYKRLAKNVFHIRRAINQHNFLEACDFLKHAHGANWEPLLREFFFTPQYRPAPIHQAIFDLDVRIVASLNFDRIYDSYAQLASEGTIIVRNYYDPNIRQVVAGNDRYLIKPHGSIDAIPKMIFTLEDYAAARTEHAGFYDTMTALLHTHTFLCIGCGLSDPDLKIIFEDYRYKYGESPHFMTYPAPFNDEQSALINRTRGMNVLRYSPKNGHAELTESLMKLAKEAGDKRDIIAELRSW